jgi:hypothetical protein
MSKPETSQAELCGTFSSSNFSSRHLRVFIHDFDVESAAFMSCYPNWEQNREPGESAASSNSTFGRHIDCATTRNLRYNQPRRNRLHLIFSRLRIRCRFRPARIPANGTQVVHFVGAIPLVKVG